MIENIPPCSRTKGCFCTFNDFKTFVQLSFPSLPQISTSFPNHAFRNAHFSRVRAFQQGKPPLYFVACYYAQYRMRSAILRNHLKFTSDAKIKSTFLRFHPVKRLELENQQPFLVKKKWRRRGKRLTRQTEIIKCGQKMKQTSMLIYYVVLKTEIDPGCISWKTMH